MWISYIEIIGFSNIGGSFIFRLALKDLVPTQGHRYVAEATINKMECCMFVKKASFIFAVTASLAIAVAPSASNLAMAQSSQGEWLHVGPLQSNDVQALVDYQVRSSTPAADSGYTDGPISYQDEAAPLWVNIRRADLNAGDHVFVQLISYVRSCYRGDCSNHQVLLQRDLEFAEAGRFTGELAPLTLAYQLNDGYAITSRIQYAAELVIWINGRLYKGADGRNLRLAMSW